MSFILDALKKSEADRQRQSGPALFEVKVAPPRRGLPLWAVALAVLLGVNLVIGVWMLLRQPAQPPAAAAPGAAAAASAPAPVASPGPAAPGPTGPAAAAGVVPARPAVAVGGPVLPAAASQTSGVTQPGPAPPASATPGPVLNPDDYEPATEPAAAPAFNARIKRGTESGLPLYQDAAAAPGAGLPQLHLDVHVFAASPRERFVMINTHKLREGDSLPEGVRVESITPDGAVLSHNGSQFLLPRE